MKLLYKSLLVCFSMFVLALLSSCDSIDAFVVEEVTTYIYDTTSISSEEQYNNTNDSEGNGDALKNSDQSEDKKTPSEGLEFTILDGRFGYSVVGIGTCEDVNIIIPSQNLGMSVITVEAGAFQDCEHIESIVLPENIVSVNPSAFDGCSALKSITVKSKNLPEGLETIYASGSIPIVFDHEHTFIEVAGKTPTCNEKGWETYTECTVCGYSTLMYIYQDHIPDVAKEENRIDAKCMEDGAYELVTYCHLCGDELSRTKYMIKAQGHVAGDAVQSNYKEPTCKSEGSYDSVINCNVCGTWMSTRKVIVDKIPHDFENEKCKWCERSEFSEGLVFTLNEDERS